MPQPELTPIPIPAGQRWRELRVVYLPPFTFLLLVGVICWMWASYVQPSSIIGEVESVHANVISTVAGTVQELSVDRLQTVTNGQPLAVVNPLDPDQLNAELAAVEADLRLMKARMDIDKTRNADSYSRLRTDWLTEKLNLDLARIRLQQAEGELARAQKLLDARLIAHGVSTSQDLRNEFGYDVTLRDRDSLLAEVASREKTVADLDSSIKRMESSGVVQVDAVDAAVEQAVQAERARIERLQKPVVLRSPMDGFISDVNHRPGEKITAGQAIVVVSADKSDRVVAWVHQPVTVRPQVGDTVEVRRMGMGQRKYDAKIIKVGSQLEPVAPLLRSPTANPERIEVGLPLLVRGQTISELIPGEPVLVRIIKAANHTAPN